MAAGTRMLTYLGIVAVLLGGCSGPTATLDLITVARKALTSAQQQQEACHAELMSHFDKQTMALDQAFDADVRFVAAGQVKDASGNPVALTSQWVISARKGYAAARDILAEEKRSAEAAHLVRLDNLRAADEAMEMASQLTIQQWSVTQSIKQHLISAQRRLIHGQ